MNKRICTTLLAALMCLACAFSFSACGGGNDVNISKGAEVTKAEWEAAFAATRTAKNVAFCVAQRNESAITYESDTNKSLSEERKDYKVDGKKVHYDTTITQTAIGNTFAYNLEHYELIKDNYCWSAIYRNETYGKDFVGTAGTDWSVSKNIYKMEDGEAEHYAGTLLSNIFETFEYYCLELRGERVLLEDLYEQFTFNEGFYVAQLPSNNGYRNVKNEISVAIKDGFVTGVRWEEETKTNNLHSESYYCVTIKNYGKTSVSFPKDVQKAFDYAQSNAENNG